MIVNMNVNVVRKSRDMWGLGQNITVITLLTQNIQNHVLELYGFIHCLLQASFSLFTTNIRDVSFMNVGISAKKSCVSYPGPGQNRLMLHADSSSLLKPSTPHHGCNAHRQTHSHMSQLGSMLVLCWLGTVNLNLNGKATSFIDYHLSKSILNSA